MAKIIIKNLSKKFNDTLALNNINLEFEENKITGLLGTNGAGKSTLIRILTGEIKATSGEVSILGIDINNLDKIRKLVNVSPQENAIISNLTVYENLCFFQNLYGLNDKENLEKIIKQFNLQEYRNKRAKVLSGGYKRRLSIAISMITAPRIIFLDEPTLGLDVVARHALWRIIREISKNTTIVITSHYLEEIESLCDEVAILSKGELKAFGNISEIKAISGKDTFEDAFIEIVGDYDEI